MEDWIREHPLLFLHEKYGKLNRTEHREWQQTHPEDGLRTLKAESLKCALVEACTPYKKPKVVKSKSVKSVRKKKTSIKIAKKLLSKPKNLKTTLKPEVQGKTELKSKPEKKLKSKKTVKHTMPVKKTKEPVNKKPSTKKTNNKKLKKK